MPYAINVTPFFINETEAFTVNQDPEGLVYYEVLDARGFRNELKDVFGEESTEYLAALHEFDVPEGYTAQLTDALLVQLTGPESKTVTLWEFSGHPEGTVNDQRQGNPLAADD